MKTSALLYILEPDTTYLITVSADGQDSNRPGQGISGEVTTLKLGNEYDVDVQAEATVADSIRVTWKPPKVYKTDDIRVYSLYLWESPVDLNVYSKPIATHFAERNVTAHTFKSLSPFTTYTVIVKLVLSDDSNPSDFGLALATTGGSIPKDIWFPLVRSRLVMVAWRGPQSANGNKMEYQIVAKDTNTNKCLKFKSTKSSALLYILQPDTTYLITVSADGQDSNRPGQGISGEVTTLKLGNEYDVDVQAEATGADSIRVTWKPPKVYKTDDIRVYSLYLWESPVDLNEYSKPIATHFAERNVTAHTFKSLSPFTTYTVMVKLVLSDDSNPSDFGLALATTGGSIPKDIWFPLVRSRLVMVAWRGPQSANGNKMEYQIVAKDTNTNICLKFKSTKSSALLYILQPDTTYLITVSADGQDSNRPGQGISGEVTTLKLGNEYDVDVQAEATGADSIRVTWKPPKVYKTDDIRVYSLYLWESPVDLNEYSKPIATHFAERNVTAHTFKSLSPFTTYTVMVKLVLSDDSNPSDFGLALATTEIGWAGYQCRNSAIRRESAVRI
ncbi:hypothetical protein SprV_0100464700 [Sparganum proliferum]